MFRSVRLSTLLFVIFICSTVIYAQDAATCQALIEQVFTSILDNCADVAPNRACYGHPVIEVDDHDNFETLGQTLALMPPYRITLRAVRIADNSWGATVFTLQPTTDASNSILVLGFGTAGIESRALPEAIYIQFRTGLHEVPCDGTQAALVLFVEDGRTSEITINGSLVEISGLVTLQWTSENSLVASVHTGQMVILGQGRVQAQQTASAILDNSLVQFWSAPREINTREHQLGTQMQDLLTSLTGRRVILPTESATSEPIQLSVCAESVQHVIARGENLYRIGLRYGVTVDAIADANNITDYTTLPIGRILIIPCGVDTGEMLSPPRGQCGTNTTHTVRRGDTVYSIARGYGTTVAAIVAANNLADPTLIHAGLQLRVPCDNGQVNQPPPTAADPNAPEFCANILASAPPGGLPEDMVNLFNQYCT